MYFTYFTTFSLPLKFHGQTSTGDSLFTNVWKKPRKQLTVHMTSFWWFMVNQHRWCGGDDHVQYHVNSSHPISASAGFWILTIPNRQIWEIDEIVFPFKHHRSMAGVHFPQPPTFGSQEQPALKFVKVQLKSFSNAWRHDTISHCIPLLCSRTRINAKWYRQNLVFMPID